MKGRMNSEYGEIVIDPDVVATYAGSMAVECFGIVGMAAVSVKDGLVKLLKRESLKHGINVRIENNRITLTLHIIVAYGVSILAVSDNLVENVKYKVEEFTGMKVDRIDIVVEGVRVID
jgi:uncharacterized alkaline shock family protein YloU